MKTKELARQAVRAAARLRAECGFGPTESVCPFDIAEQLGIATRLVALPSMEGMYSPTPWATILVSSERPRGRRRYTCAHEIGHHVFKHGARLDELAGTGEVRQDPEELIAQRFAAALLMPKFAIEAAFAKRGWSISEPTAKQCFLVAQELGVGYVTLIRNLHHTLQLMPSSVAESLMKAALPALRAKIAGFEVDHDVLVVDGTWAGRSVDVEVGDVVLLAESATISGSCVESLDSPALHLIAVRPGVAVATLEGGRSIAVRVSRRGFSGLARYRYLEEVTDE